MVFGCRESTRGLDTSATAPKPTSRRHVRHTMSTVLTLTRAHYEGALVQPPHAHDALQISMLLTGRVEETVGGTTHDAAPLHVAVKDAGLEHANRWAEGGTTLLRLEAPGESLASLTGRPTAPTWRWRFDPVAIRAFLRLAANVNAEGVIEGDTDGSDLLAALVAEPRDTPSGTPPRWLTDVIERLVAEWTPRLDTGVIATWAHVHPVYLARCVRRWYSVSVGDLLRRLLAWRMHRRLALCTIPCTLSLLSAAALPAQSASRMADTMLVRAVDSLVQHAVVRGITPGFGLAIVRDGHVLARRAFGLANASRDIRATPHTRWYLASTSKSLTGFAMALLADRGTLPFSTSVRDALPGSTWHDGVVVDALTIAQLLSHTHNLTDNVIVVSSAFTGAIPEPQWPSLLASVPPARRPALIYSNFGYNVAGMILDRRTPGGWRAFLDSAVLHPAGMRHTTAQVSSVPPALLAMPHDYASLGFTTLPFEKRDQTMHAAGGHVATLDDLARWVQIQLDSGVVDGRRVFPATAVRLAHTLIAAHTESRGKRYAYFDRDGWSAGWDVGRYDGEPMVSRFGGYATMRSHLSFLPERRIGVVAMSNGGLGSSLTDVVAAYIYDLDRGRPDAATRAWTRVDSLHTSLSESRRAALLADSQARTQERTPPGVPIGTLLGRYTSPELGTLTIVRNGPSIAVRWGVLAAPVRTVDAADGTYRVAGGGTEFSLRFEWSGDAGRSPATAAVVNGSVMRRVK